MAKILISLGSTMPKTYEQGVARAGGEPISRYLPGADMEADGLILAGGGDVMPCLFGQTNCGSRDIDPDRDRAELALLDAFASAGKPALGICRGHQLVNVWAGGSLIQDLGRNNRIHRWDGGDRVHPIMAGGFLGELYGLRFWVNSAHHQAVGVLGCGLRAVAHGEDGTVEAMEHRRLPIYTVQFHPERMKKAVTADGQILLRWFVEKCGADS